MKSLKKQLFIRVLIMLAVSVIVVAAFTEILSYRNLLRAMQDNVRSESRLISDTLNRDGDSLLDKDFTNLTDNRVTLIDTDGTILYDSEESDISGLGNHADRPEVISALESGEGEATRFSDTLGKTTYYYAIRLDNGQVLRTAGTIESVISSFLGSLLIIALIMAVIISVAFLLIRHMTYQIVRPINRLDLEHPMCNNTYTELEPLMHRIEDQNHTISTQMEDIRRTREESLAITEHMQDGFIITNMTSILSINHAALHFFHVSLRDVQGHNILTISREPEIKDAWNKAIHGKHYDGQIKLDGKVYELLGNPVTINETISGAVLLIIDVTEKERNDEMRREFTANVSHELKTPLMSISGYAELIETGIAQKKDIPGFAGKIRSESARLTSLVEDIIRLSELDEMQDTGNESIDLHETAKEALDNLTFTAHRMKIALSLKGDSVFLKGNKKILYEMIRNLVDNGIKYNHPHGYVTVLTGYNKNGNGFISVEDNGIGIPEEDRDRIFERFYRVDKSHSRETGGTGLGLSIVKHAAILHGGATSVESKCGEGTKITVTFNRIPSGV